MDGQNDVNSIWQRKVLIKVNQRETLDIGREAESMPIDWFKEKME